MKARTRRSWRLLWSAFRQDILRERRLMAAAYSCRVLAVVATVLAPWPVKFVIDGLTTGWRLLPLPWLSQGASADALVLILTGAFFALATIAAISGAAEKNLSARVRERVTFALRDRLVSHVLTLSPAFRVRHRSGELVLRIVDDSDLFVRVLTKTVPLIFQQAASLLVTLGMMVFVDPRVALAGCAWLPVCAVILRRDARRLWGASREKRVREGDVCSLTQEIVRGLAVIQASGGESSTRRAFEQVNGRRVSAGREETAMAVSLERKLQMLQAIAVGLVTATGAWLVIHRQMTIGDLTLMTAYVGQVLRPIEKLNDLAETTGRGLAGGERLLKLLEQRPAVSDAPGAVAIPSARGVLELDDVWYSYPDRSRPVLCGVYLQVVPGELTVLTGASGAGKSTLLSLIVRLADPTRGEVRLDGRPLTGVRLRSLREQFAVLSQDTHLFAGSVRSALQADGESRPEGDLWDALEKVSLAQFVRQLPAQLDTLVGEDGIDLSGGQRRRVALARAFLLRRPVLLLDEPLVNIDTESAEVILNAIERWRRHGTCFAITHDAALVARADRVYRLEGGRVFEISCARLAEATEVG